MESSLFLFYSNHRPIEKHPLTVFNRVYCNTVEPCRKLKAQYSMGTNLNSSAHVPEFPIWYQEQGYFLQLINSVDCDLTNAYRTFAHHMLRKQLTMNMQRSNSQSIPAVNMPFANETRVRFYISNYLIIIVLLFPTPNI